MTWAGQVWHSLRADVRHARWMVVLYIALIVFATVEQVVRPRVVNADALSFLPMALMATALFIVVTAVQWQSPSADGAFWRSLPLSPSAVIASKIALVAALLVPGLVGQYVALTPYQPDADQMRTALVDSVWPFLWLSAVALLISSQTRTLLNFFLVLVAIPIVFAVVMQLSPDFAISGSSAVADATVEGRSIRAGVAFVAALVAAAVFVLLDYVRPFRRRTALLWCVGLVAAVTIADYLFGHQGDWERVSVSHTSRSAAMAMLPVNFRISGTITVLSPAPSDPTEIGLAMQLDIAGGDPHERLVLEEASVLFTLPDGDTVRVRVSEYLREENQAATVVRRATNLIVKEVQTLPGTTIGWPAAASLGMSRAYEFTAFVRKDLAVLLRDRQATARIDGVLTRLQARTAIQLPFVRGASSVARGWMISLTDAQFSPGVLSSAVDIRSIRPETNFSDFDLGGARSPSLLLVDTVRREARALEGLSAVAYIRPPVLYGVGALQIQMQLRKRSDVAAQVGPASDATPSSLAWQPDATLRIIEWTDLARHRFSTPAQPVVAAARTAEVSR